jgi:hypothetical protein
MNWKKVWATVFDCGLNILDMEHAHLVEEDRKGELYKLFMEGKVCAQTYLYRNVSHVT